MDNKVCFPLTDNSCIFLARDLDKSNAAINIKPDDISYVNAM